MTMERPAPGRQGGTAFRAPAIDEQNWWWHAACMGEPHELFFDCTSPVKRDKAKAICAGCPVRDACLRAAMAEESNAGQSAAQNRKVRFGIRGGLTSGERWLLAHPGQKPRPDEADAS